MSEINYFREIIIKTYEKGKEDLESVYNHIKDEFEDLVIRLRYTVGELSVLNMNVVDILSKTKGRVRVIPMESEMGHNLHVKISRDNFVPTEDIEVPSGKYKVIIMVMEDEDE